MKRKLSTGRSRPCVAKPDGPRPARRAVASLSALSLLLSSVFGSLAPAYGQVITDPTAPIQFRSNVTSSGNGTPTVNIVKPSQAGISHNQFRQYNIDTRGLILNNSGLGGTSIIGGKVAKNPNLKPGGEARIILNEVTGTRRSTLNGVTEVFGKKADVIVANPNGIGCAGCGFINTGSATLTTGVPIVDYKAGTISFETRKGDITISGAGVSAPAGQMPDQLNLIARTLRIDGLVDARDKASLTAGATRIDPATGQASRIADAALSRKAEAIVSGPAGVIRAASIDVLSADLDLGVTLAGNLQALGSYNSEGNFVPGDLKIVAAGDLNLVSGEASGEAAIEAAGFFQLAHVLSAAGAIAITARDISLLDSAGLHAGDDLQLVAQADIASAAVIKSGDTLAAKAGDDASFSGLIAAVDGLVLKAGDQLATDNATLIAPTIELGGAVVDVSATWVVPGKKATLTGSDVTLGADTIIDPKAEASVEASKRLTIASIIDTDRFPQLALAFSDLVIAEGGAFVSDNHDIDAQTIDVAGLLQAREHMALTAEIVQTAASGTIQAATIAIETSDNLINLGRILSASTLDLVAGGTVFNDGAIHADVNADGIGNNGIIELQALSYIAGSQAELIAAKAYLILHGDLTNAGLIAVADNLNLQAGSLSNAASGEIAAKILDAKIAGELTNLGQILSQETLAATVTGALANAGTIHAGNSLSLTAADLINTGASAAIDSKGDLAIHSRGSIDNDLGSILASSGFELVAGARLTNSGLLYSDQYASILASQFDNRTTGQLFAGIVNVDLDGGDLANLGQIVSADTLDLIKAGDVLNDGIVQAGGRLSLEALSYTANVPQAELAAAKADLILDGMLKNAGLIAVADNLNLEAGSLSNAASGEIVAKALEAEIAGDLTNLGSLLSEEALLATVTGLVTNQGAIHAGGDLNLTAADLANNGADALIAGSDDVAIDAAGSIANDGASIAAGNAMRLTAAAGIVNSGLLESANSLSLTANLLDNAASGRIHAGTVQNTADGILHVGSLTIELGGDLANLGAIVSANALAISGHSIINNTGSIEAGGSLRLEAHAYRTGSQAARLAARNAQLILGASLVNDGLLSIAGRLGLAIDGNLTNSASGRIEAVAIEAEIAQNLTNLGTIVSEDTLKATVTGLLTNKATIHSATDMALQTGSLINQGQYALIGASGDLSIKTAGNLDNLLGRILAEGALAIEAGGTLSNASARIESGADMVIAAATLINTAIAGTDGGAIKFHELGDLTVDYAYDHDDGFSDKDQTYITAVQDTFSGTIHLDRPGIIRAGQNLTLDTDTLHNDNGRILAVNDLSIDTHSLLNEAQTYAVDHYQLEWWHETDDDYLPFTAPAGGGWVVRHWTPDALTDEAFDAIVDGMPRHTVTESEFKPAKRSDPGAVYSRNGPNGPGYYVEVTTSHEEVIVGYRIVRERANSGGEGGGKWIYRKEPISYRQDFLYTREGRMIVFDTIGSMLIAKGGTPVSVRGSDDVSQAEAEDHARLKILQNTNAAEYLNLQALGIDPSDIPDTVVLSSRIADLGSRPYHFKGKTYQGTATVAQGSVIKSGGALLIDSHQTANRGTIEGSLVAIEGGTLDNGIGAIGNINGSGFGQFDGSVPGDWEAGQGSAIAGLDPSRHSAGVVDFVLDDVAVPPLDLGPFNARSLVSLDPDDFGKLAEFTGSLEAARLLAGAFGNGADGTITGSKLSFYADPVREAQALAEAALRATGSHLVIDPSLSARQQRQLLYRNAAAFAEATSAQYGIALTEAQRAALTQPIVWHETRIVNGKPVLVPVLYLPAADELLRGGRGPGMIAAQDLLIDLSGRLSNTGALTASGLASISASSIINQRMIDLDMRSRAYAGGRGDTGLISAGTLLMTTDADLLNHGGAIASAGSLDLRIGGKLLNITQRYTRAVDGFDLCLGNACGGDAIAYNVAKIITGRDLTIIAGQDLINAGGEIGSVTDMLLAAEGDVRFLSLKDSFLTKDFHQRGFLSGKDIVEHTITTAEATAQSLVGDVSILAGFGVCDGGSLCAGNNKADAILNGALVTAYGDVSINATGAIDMGAVSKEVHNTYREWGIKGLGWGKVKQTWNDVDTSVTRISGNNVTLNAKGPITGTGTKIAAAGDLLMMTDADMAFKAAQDARYFTEKGFYIGVTFPGSAGINAALQGGQGSKVLTGLADINPLTRTLASLANADNGLAAGLAAVNLATRGLGVFGRAAPEFSKLGIDGGGAGLGKAIADELNPLSQFTDEKGNFSAANIGIAISTWKNEQRWSESQAAELAAGGDIVMKAGLDAILDQGTKLIAGEDVSIDAGRDIAMAALTDYVRDKSSSFGLSITPASIGFDIGKSQGYDESLSNAVITAGGNVSLASGRDTAILGGNISGRSIEIEAGRDLTVLSPQARGWRDGYSFGLTIGLDAFSLGIRGSKEDGSKAWSSGSAILADKLIDITVDDDTILDGALLHATDGDIRLDTDTLTVTDNNDHDQYKNIGGSIGLNASGISSVGFSYEEKDKRGKTRTTLDAAGKLDVTIHDADSDGTPDTAADKTTQQQQIAAIPKDAGSWQQITKDKSTKLSGDLDVQALRNVASNIRAINNYIEAVNAPVPDTVQARGAENVDYYRRLRANGLTTQEAQAALQTPQIQSLVSTQQNWNEAVTFYGSPGAVPPEVKAAVASGIDFDFSQGAPMVRRAGCGTYGPGCLYEFNKQAAGPGSIQDYQKFATLAVSDAEKAIKSLVPELNALIERELQEGSNAALSLEIEKLKAQLAEAALIYELCYDTVDAEPLADVVGPIVKGMEQAAQADGQFPISLERYAAFQTAGYVENAASDARTKASYKNSDHINNADMEALDLVGVVSGGTAIAGKFIIVNGVKAFQTAAGQRISKDTIDHLVAKGKAFVDNGSGAVVIRKAAPKGGIDDLISGGTRRSADDVNATFPDGYSPPYTPGTQVTEFVSDGNQTFVRVVSGDSPGGQWVMKASDIEGLSPQQIADKFALPEVPTGITSVTPPAGTRIRTGEVNPNFGGAGGGTQFQLLDRINDGWADVTPLQ